MANRPIFLPTDNKDEPVSLKKVDFTWHAGLAKSQKQKSIKSLHDRAKNILNLKNILEISTKSLQDIGTQASAFNLKLSWESKHSSVESFYQGSKVFKNGGPYLDIYDSDSVKAKKDDRIKNSGQLLGFSFFGEEWTLEQDFYSWIYLIALSQNIKISDELLKFDAFTDIEFNMEKSFNCQAYSAALYVSLIKYKKLDLTQIQLPLEFKKNTPKKISKNIQNELF